MGWSFFSFMIEGYYFLSCIFAIATRSVILKEFEKTECMYFGDGYMAGYKSAEIE